MRTFGIIGKTSVASIVGLAAGLSLAAVANAEPSGCSHTTTATYTGPSNAMKINGDGSGYCDSTTTRNMRGEIKRDVSGLPDPLVAANEHSSSGHSHSVHVESCDGGRTDVYYARSFYTSSPTYIDSVHYTFHTCK